MTEDDIKQYCQGQSFRWTRHALERLFQRNIHMDDVKAALVKGEIIEQYPTDLPFPSCLVLGYTRTGEPLHIVCGSNGIELWIITAYFPNPVEWSYDFKQRRKP